MATLLLRDEPLRYSIASLALSRMGQFGAQHLSNTAWAFATLEYRDRPLFAAISAAAVHRIRHFTMQPLANTVWAYATLSFWNGPLLEAIALQAVKRMPQWHVQELVNTVWSVAKLTFNDAPLLASISAAAVARLPEYEARDLSITAWSLALMSCKDVPLLEAIALVSSGRLLSDECDPQNISNTAWAFATLSMSDEPLFHAISGAALARMSELSAQDLSIISWSFATIMWKDEPLLHAIAAAAVGRIGHFDPQHLSNTAWAYAKLGVADETLLDAIATASRRRLRELDTQNISNTLWAYAVFSMGARPLLDDLTSAALARIAEAQPQELSNTAWALARLAVAHEPLLAAISAGALRKMAELSVQDMTNIPWALVSLSVRDAPLLHAISERAVGTENEFAQPTSASMLLWTLWKASLPEAALRLFDAWSSRDVFEASEPFGLMLMDNDWWKDAGWELDVLDRMHRMFPVRSLHRSMAKLGFTAAFSTAPLHHGLQKVAKLVDFVESSAEPGSPPSVLAACEFFAKHRGQWLKVAGDEKAEILEAALGTRPLADGEVALEFGVYVGYTATRLCSSLGGRRVVSLEVSPVHVCVARHVLDVAGAAHLGEVAAGQAKDALPRVLEERGAGGVGFSFMDHRGTIFHSDCALLERSGLLGGAARLVADNALNPGSPVFLWELASGGGRERSASPYSITEFQATHEDWTAVVDFVT